MILKPVRKVIHQKLFGKVDRRIISGDVSCPDYDAARALMRPIFRRPMDDATMGKIIAASHPRIFQKVKDSQVVGITGVVPIKIGEKWYPIQVADSGSRKITPETYLKVSEQARALYVRCTAISYKNKKIENIK